MFRWQAYGLNYQHFDFLTCHGGNLWLFLSIWFNHENCTVIHLVCNFVATEKTGMVIPYNSKYLIHRIYSKFNESLYYSPSSYKMAFTVRDPVHTGLYKVTDPRGFAKR